MTGIEADPWAWAREEEVAATPDPTGNEVTVVVVAHDGDAWLPALLTALDQGTYPVGEVLAVDAGSTDGTAEILEQARRDGRVDRIIDTPASTFGEAVATALAECPPQTPWIWFLHDDAVPAPEALERLVVRGRTDPVPAAVTPLLLTPRRRGVGSVISELGVTVSRAGSVMSAETSGVIDQGQLETREVLGGSSCGLLVRTRAWTESGGFAADLPAAVQGLDLGARLARSGHSVVTEPSARIQHAEASVRGVRAGARADPAVERRAYGLGFDALLRGRPGALVPTAFGSAGTALRLLLGKDVDGVSEERAAFAAWRAGKPWRRASARRFGALPDRSVAALRPTRRDALRRAVDDLGSRITEWNSPADARGDLGIDQLTGDDFSGSALEGHRRRLPPWALVTLALTLLAVVSSRHLLGLAPLRGPQLLPAPASPTGTLHAYLDPIAGLPVGTGGPWSALMWVGSLPLLGWTDGLVSLVILGCVPATFLVTHRLLRAMTGDAVVAVLGGLAVAMAPAVVGAVGTGQLGACLGLIVGIIVAGQWWRWWTAGLTWGGAARVGIMVLVLTAFAPVPGILAWLTTIVLALLRRAGARPVLALAGPLLLLPGDWAPMMVSFPGRLLTGIAPVLAPDQVVPWWQLLLARPGSAHLPPLWLSAALIGLLWMMAVLGSIRQRGTSAWALAAAAGFGLAAVAVSRTPVAVPPADLAVPQGTELVLAMVAALVLAAGLGFAGLGERMRAEAFGARQVGTVAAAVAVGGAVILGAAWWVGWGAAPLERREVGAVPAFIAKDAARGFTRTLAMTERNGTLTWAVQEGTLPRLGDAERGLAFSGDPALNALAGEVAQRIAHGGADEEIVPDLQTLGIGSIWVDGGADTLRVDIDNIPGMGTGSVDGDTATWVVPEGGRVQIRTGEALTRLDPDRPVPRGERDRVLVLAEPADPRWRVTVDGVVLETIGGTGPPTFALGEREGRLVTALAVPEPWWAWVQAGGLLLLVVLAAPSLRPERPASPRSGRRGL
ncbi:MAG: glycosyltransferase [Propioniciclava sp.]